MKKTTVFIDEELLKNAIKVIRARSKKEAIEEGLKALADSGVFRLNGVLIGTHAFTVLGNMLGVRWKAAAIRTLDIDIAGERVMKIALPDIQADIPQALESLNMGFLPVPPLDPRNPSTSFKVRDNPLRVDIVTPAKPA